MHTTPLRATTLALALLLATAACHSTSPPAQPGPGGSGSPATAPAAGQASAPGTWTPPSGDENQEVTLTEEQFRGAGQLLPRPAELTRWFYIEQPAYYTADNLAELIDGGSASYIALGIDQAAYGVLQLRNPPAAVGRDVGLEIYIFRMASPQAAQTKWNDDHQSGTCDQAAELHTRHCVTSSTLDMLSGPYYVRFVLDAQDPDLNQPLVNAAVLVLQHINQGLRLTRPMPARPPGAPGGGAGTGP